MQSSFQDNNLHYLKLLFKSGENSDAFQHNITDFFPALIYVYDTDKKKLLYINRKVTDILGYSYNDIDAWDNDFLRFIFKDDVELVKAELQKCSELKDETFHTYKSRLNHKKGNWRYLRTHGTVLRRNPDGSAASILFIAEDMSSGLYDIEESDALKQLFNETETLLHFGTWRLDPASRKLYWSDGLYDLFGYNKEEVYDKASIEFYLAHVSASDRKTLEEHFNNAIQHKTPFDFYYTLTTANGDKKIISTRAKPIVLENGELEKIIGVTCDITDETLMLKDLAEYRQLILDKEAFLGSGSWDLDLTTQKFTWSEGEYRLFGYDPSKDELPEPGAILYENHLSESESTRLKDVWEEFLESKDEHRWEFEITTFTGERRFIETYGRVIRNHEGVPQKVFGASRDITQIKEYEKSLNHKIEELDRSNKELEEFAYIASHDLQEPLRKITTFSERLKEQVGAGLSAEANFYLDRMLIATENMRILINNLLEFSRTSRHNEAYVQLNLNKMIDEVTAELELIIDETKATIEKDDLPVIEAIPSQMRQLFGNLIANSIKFRSPDVSPLIKISAKKLLENEKELEQLPHDKHYYRFDITDNGIGFDQEYAIRIFQIFQRLHGKSEYPGSGIGLAICKKIVENHNGTIYARSASNKGATFVIFLPENQS